MKKLLKTILFLSLLLFIITPVFAQTARTASCPTCSSTPQELQQENRQSLQEIKEGVLEYRETLREQIQERQATKAARLAERKRERIRLYFGRLTTRLQAAISRLERLISRIESRLSKIEEDNEDIDTAVVRKDLDTAKDKLASTSAALSQAKTSLEDILTANEPKEAFAEIRDLIQGIKQELIEVHRILVHVIGDIKGLRIGQGSVQPEATPEGE